jgi:hypothetical protein
MRPYGTSSADSEVDAVLRSEPPMDGASLNAGSPWPSGRRQAVTRCSC